MEGIGKLKKRSNASKTKAIGRSIVSLFFVCLDLIH